MVSPGGSFELACTPDDLRQLAEHDAEHRTFAGGAGPLAALDTGGGARGTVLLVAGYTGTKEDFAPLLRPLHEAGYRAVTMDQRGQYQSPGPDDDSRYTVDELAGDVVAVGRALLAECGRPLHLVGHSFGGLVSRAAVLAEPGLFDSLTLLGSGPSGLTGPRAELLEHLSPLLAEGGVARVHEMLEQLALTRARSYDMPQPTKEFLTTVFLQHSEAGLRGMAEAMVTEPDRVDELAATGVPVLVAHGVADDAWTPAAQADMARRLGARHEVVEGSIHSPAVENAPRTLEVLLDFWAALGAAPERETDAAARS